jgi:hypothetical protein
MPRLIAWILVIVMAGTLPGLILSSQTEPADAAAEGVSAHTALYFHKDNHDGDDANDWVEALAAQEDGPAKNRLSLASDDGTPYEAVPNGLYKLRVTADLDGITVSPDASFTIPVRFAAPAILELKADPGQTLVPVTAKGFTRTVKEIAPEDSDATDAAEPADGTTENTDNPAGDAETPPADGATENTDNPADGTTDGATDPTENTDNPTTENTDDP